MGFDLFFLVVCGVFRAFAALVVLVLQLIENFKIVVGRIEFGTECAPDAMFESEIHLTEFIGRQPESDDVPNAHDNVVG